SAFVVGVEIRNLRMDDDRNADRGCCQVLSVRAIDHRQLSKHVAVAHNHELPWLLIAGAAGSAADLEDIAHYFVREWIGSKLAHRAQVAQEADPIGSHGICHRELADLSWCIVMAERGCGHSSAPHVPNHCPCFTTTSVTTR